MWKIRGVNVKVISIYYTNTITVNILFLCHLSPYIFFRSNWSPITNQILWPLLGFEQIELSGIGEEEAQESIFRKNWVAANIYSGPLLALCPTLFWALTCTNAFNP